jgi:hypothetical protein
MRCVQTANSSAKHHAITIHPRSQCPVAHKVLHMDAPSPSRELRLPRDIAAGLQRPRVKLHRWGPILRGVPVSSIRRTSISPRTALPMVCRMRPVARRTALARMSVKRDLTATEISPVTRLLLRDNAISFVLSVFSPSPRLGHPQSRPQYLTALFIPWLPRLMKCTT